MTSFLYQRTDFGNFAILASDRKEPIAFVTRELVAQAIVPKLPEAKLRLALPDVQRSRTTGDFFASAPDLKWPIGFVPVAIETDFDGPRTFRLATPQRDQGTIRYISKDAPFDLIIFKE